MATSAPPIPRVELAYAPTPLLKLERLSAELGVELWVKRDDLTGLLETGNGQSFNLGGGDSGGIKAEVTHKVCDMVLQHAKSLL